MANNVVFDCAEVAAALRAVAASGDYSSVVQFNTKVNTSSAGKFVDMWLTINGVQGRPKNIRCRSRQKGAIAPPTEQAAAIVNAKRDTTKYGPAKARKKAAECQIAFYPFKEKKKVKDDGITWEDGETPATPDDWTDFYTMLYHINEAFKKHITWMIQNRLIVSAQDSAQGMVPGAVIHNNQRIVDMVQTQILGENAPPEKMGKILCVPIPRCKVKFDEQTLLPKKCKFYDRRTARKLPNGQEVFDLFTTSNGSPITAMNIHEEFLGDTDHEFMISMYVMLSNFGITCSRVVGLSIAEPPEFNAGADLSMMGYAAAPPKNNEVDAGPPPQPNYSQQPAAQPTYEQQPVQPTYGQQPAAQQTYGQEAPPPPDVVQQHQVFTGHVQQPQQQVTVNQLEQMVAGM